MGEGWVVTTKQNNCLSITLVEVRCLLPLNKKIALFNVSPINDNIIEIFYFYCIVICLKWGSKFAKLGPITRTSFARNSNYVENAPCVIP